MGGTYAPDRCRMGCGPRGHPKLACPVCGHAMGHLQGLSVHLGLRHGYWTGSRNHSLAMDIARALAKGWPIRPALVRAELAGIPILRGVELA